MLHQASKRKLSATDLFDSGKTIQKRSSKACNCCRYRKVRCDVVGMGIPCTNCRIDQVECLITEGKQRKKTSVETSVVNPLPTPSSEGGNNEPRPSSAVSDIEGSKNRFSAAQSTSDDWESLLAWEDTLPRHRLHKFNRSPGDRLSSQERVRRVSVAGQLNKTMQPPLRSPQTSDRPEIGLPEYITSMPRRMTSEDIEFLQKKGAFLIPEPAFRNELLHCYLQFVHPYLPVLDLEEFLTKIENNDPQGTIGLLLFQAVMLAGIPYVDMSVLAAHGYHTRKEAGQAFFQRVKLLYDFYYEADRINVVQSVLLMTVWWETTDNPKEIWQLLGVAISLARTIGLDRDTTRSQLPGQRQRLWKRIWWSCYMKDRLIAMAMRRPSRIQDDDFNLPMLRLDDFETAPLPPKLGYLIGRCSAASDASTRETLAEMCIAMAKCCRCITPILACQYPSATQSAETTQETSSWPAPSRTVPDPYEILRCDRELEVWYSGLSDELRWFRRNSRERASNNDDDVIELHRFLLTGIYLAASSVLHHPQIMPSSPNLDTVPELQDLSVRRAREAAGLTTEIYRTLSAHNLLRYLPDTGVTALLPALMIHLTDTKSTDSATRKLSIRRFHFCMSALRQLSDMYAYADSVISSFEAAVRKAGIPMAAAFSSAPTQPSTDKQHSSFPSPTAYASTPQVAQSPETPQTAEPAFQATQVAHILMSNCTLTQQELHLFAGLTPPNSDSGSPSDSTKTGGSIGLSSVEVRQAERIFQESSWAEQTMRQRESRPARTSFSAVAQAGWGETVFDDDLFQDLQMDWLPLPFA